jgi:hypothetical protein
VTAAGQSAKEGGCGATIELQLSSSLRFWIVFSGKRKAMGCLIYCGSKSHWMFKLLAKRGSGRFCATHAGGGRASSGRGRGALRKCKDGKSYCKLIAAKALGLIKLYFNIAGSFLEKPLPGGLPKLLIYSRLLISNLEGYWFRIIEFMPASLKLNAYCQYLPY